MDPSLATSPTPSFDSPSTPSSSSSSSSPFLSSWKIWVILFVVLAFLGFNIFLFLGKETNQGIHTVQRLFSQFMETLRKPITKMEPHKHSLPYEKPTHLQRIEEVHASPPKEKEVLQPPPSVSPLPDDALTSSIQSGKAGWCFVGVDRGFRSCVQVEDQDACMSGDIFPSKDQCVNPRLRY